MGKYSGSRRKKTLESTTPTPKRDWLTLFIVYLAVGVGVGMIVLMGLYQHDTEVRESYDKGRQDVVEDMYRSSGMCQGIKLNGRYGVVEWIPKSCCQS